MKYYELDSVEREFHNKLLVDILSLALQQGYSNALDTRIPYKDLERFDIGGEGQRIREAAVKYVVTHINALADQTLLPNLMDLTGRFKNLDRSSPAFEENYLAELDKTTTELMALVGKKDDVHRDRAIIGRLWELSDARYYIARASEKYVFRWKSAQIKLQLEQAYEDGRLDRELVDKILSEVFDAETDGDWVESIREVVNIFSTKLE